MLAATPLLTSWDILGIEVASGVGALALAAVGVFALRARRAPLRSGREAAGDPGGKGPGLRRLVERGVLAVFVAALVGLVTAAADYVVTTTARTGRIYRVGSADVVRDDLRGSPEPHHDPVEGLLASYEVRFEGGAVVVCARRLPGSSARTDGTGERPAAPGERPAGPDCERPAGPDCERPAAPDCERERPPALRRDPVGLDVGSLEPASGWHPTEREA